MAYSGTTSTAPNVPMLQAQAMTAQGFWRYNSTHTQSEAAAGGFFTDGQNLGMLVRDRVEVIGSTTLVFSDHAVIAVTATGVSLSEGLVTSSAT